MPTVKLSDVRSVRAALGVSQSQAAVLLGLSAKAVQSYEQGFRNVPAHVQRKAALLLYLRWRDRHGAPRPCWQVNRCGREARAQCPTFQLRAGDLCWMLTGTLCRDRRREAPAAKLARCQQCPVMRRWLKD
jgi:transcriptional regulator with XRE-family HTH domain